MVLRLYTLGCILLILQGCITTESCTRSEIMGVKIEIGCDEIVMQPITRSRTLETQSNENSGDFSEK